MANAIVTLKIMPETPDIDLDTLKDKIKKQIADFAGEGETKDELEPVAFGLKCLKIIFVMDENIGSTEDLENNICEIEGVQSAEVSDVRRALG